MNHPRVLLADDHIIVLQGLQALLDGEFDIAGSVTDGRALVLAARRLKPDVIVTDISMPILNGIDAVRQLRGEGDKTKVVMLTMHTDAQIAVEAFRAGATGYVIKQSAGDELIAAIHAALQGLTYLTPLVAQDVLQLLLNSGSQPEQQVVRSASRQSVLLMIAEGHTPNEISGVLNLPVRTIESHKHEMMQTLGVQTTSELVQLVIQMGLVANGQRKNGSVT